MQLPEESVWQMKSDSGRLRGNRPTGVSVGANTMVPAAPISIDAATINPIPFVPLITTLPSCVNVSAIESMSGMGVLLTVRRKVLSPATLCAGLGVLLHWNTNAISSEKIVEGREIETL